MRGPMSEYVVVRPIWRRFRSRWLARAAAHVRRGGFAAIADETGGVKVLLPVDEAGKITELGQWALLAIEQQRAQRVKEGLAKGLLSARIRPSFAGSVLDWCDRDSVHEGSTRAIELNCLECSACCHEANVLLDKADFQRFREGGRPDLVGKAYIRRARDGKVTLRFAADGRCQHLMVDKKCAIYAIRPDNCSAFVVGSEACLAAREDTLGLRDGAPEVD
jgi:uncharacterized protein